MQVLTPPNEPQSQYALSTALNLLNAKAQALSFIAETYGKDTAVQDRFFRALTLLHSCIMSQGKIVATAMGKSLKIAEKLVATLHSFGIPVASLHPSDALHGDLGMIRPRDVVIMISSSGATPELLKLWDHLAPNQVVIVLTCSPESKMGRRASEVIPVLVKDDLQEVSVYGLAAPTVTTTACLAVGDAMCVALYELIEPHYNLRRHKFGVHHPGGAIGQAYSGKNNLQIPSVVAWHEIPQLCHELCECSELDLWHAASQSVFMMAKDLLYLSADVMDALKQRSRDVVGQSISDLPYVEGAIEDCKRISLLVEQSQPQGVVWCSDWAPCWAADRRA